MSIYIDRGENMSGMTSIEVSEEQRQLKRNQGVSWSWLIQRGLEAKANDSKRDRMVEMIDTVCKENDILKEKIKTLELMLLRR
jgi:hypothetical protein